MLALRPCRTILASPHLHMGNRPFSLDPQGTRSPDVDSYYITAVEPAVLIDPRVPAEGLAWFDRRARPVHV